MLKKETIDLVKDINFKNIFSICIGKTYLFQSRFIDYLGNYNSWDTNVKEGILKLADRKFNVEYIGTTSDSDNYWYSSELESVIPDSYVDLMMKTRKYMDSLGFSDFTKDGKIVLDGDINGYNLSMIYIAFAPLNVAYFCGSGNTNIYMFVKDLPDEMPNVEKTLEDLKDGLNEKPVEPKKEEKQEPVVKEQPKEAQAVETPAPAVPEVKPQQPQPVPALSTQPPVTTNPGA